MASYSSLTWSGDPLTWSGDPLVWNYSGGGSGTVGDQLVLRWNVDELWYVGPWVLMDHASTTGTAWATQAAFDKVWQPKGWFIVGVASPNPPVYPADVWVQMDHPSTAGTAWATPAAFTQVWQPKGWVLV